MRRTVYIILVALMSMVGCKSERAIYTDDLCARFAPSFDANSKAGSNSGDSRAVSSLNAFANGDRVGIYMVKQGQTLRSQFNAMDNRLFAYNEALDVLDGIPTAVFYPDNTTPTTAYAYYPYKGGLPDALQLPFAVSSDLKVSDLCMAVSAEQAPSDGARALKFKHALSKLAIEVDFSKNNRVESITSIEMLSVYDSCVLNLVTGVTTAKESHSADITAMGVEFILPPQALHAGKLVRLVDDKGNEYYYEPLISPLTLIQGSAHTLKFTILDNNSVAAGVMDIGPWKENSTQGTADMAVRNSFTLHWSLPHQNYPATSTITFNVRDGRNGYLTPYSVKNLVLMEGHSTVMASFTFDLADSLLSYPYTIETVDFNSSDGVLIQSCKSMIAATVYRQGALTLGVEQDNLLMITTGTITNWTPGSGEGEIGGAVANSFVLELIAKPLFAQLNKVKMTIAGVVYNFNGVTATGNTLIARSSVFTLPDAASTLPKKYPYTISKVEVLKADGGVLYTYSTAYMVSGKGEVLIQIY